jgi:putative peptidoglycan lipid II flippase
LAKHYSDNDTVEYSKLLDWGLRMTLLLASPAAVALGILAVPLISTLFFHGQFTPEDVQKTRWALVAYSIGLLGLILVKVLAPGFYARQNIKTPVKIAVMTLLATQAMNLAFIVPFKHAGLALSIGLGACLNAGILYHNLRKQRIFQPQPGWQDFLRKLLAALVVMAVGLWLGMMGEARWLEYPTRMRVIHLAALVVGGAGSYFATLWLLGFRPKDFHRRAA